MALCRIVFLTLVLSVVYSFAVRVPVFSWGDLSKVSIKSNPLSIVSSDEFSSILKQELKNDPFTVIFIEETLSVEDFSRKNDDSETSFPYLHANIGDAQYLPSVEHPLRVLNKLADPEKVNHVKLTENGLSADIEPESGNFLFINLKDAREGESRADLLRRHNDFMEDMFSKLQERYDSVVAIYTAHYPSWTIPESHSRVRREALRNESTSSDYILDGLRLYAEKIMYGNGVSVTNLGEITGSTSEFNVTVMNTTLTFNNAPVRLALHFKNQAGYWFFDSVTVMSDSYSVNLPSTLEVYALDGFSYRCGDNVSFTSVNDTATPYNVTFVDLKVQPFFETLNETEMVFGDSFNCVGFFSVPIWSSLFVVFILLSITFYGIMMMMDIRTMDRFDDPKGKTITINAE
ncbi:unnamed protein product [Diatraea saccharalis]|uniref:V-type proton ATPase subunit S1 n=1 Tax=Diatraea saccharalis TaxID=40085 RepID=A0A9N9WGB9_9NEOP|nr:unnamed protein product [Diatraea saccharalis]